MNSESLKLLNAYADDVAEGKQIRRAIKLSFLVMETQPAAVGKKAGPAGIGSQHLRKVSLELPASGSFTPLFRAFHLLDEDQQQQSAEACNGDRTSASTMRELRDWLRENAPAVTSAHAQFSAKQSEMNLITFGIKTKFGISIINVSHVLLIV